MKQISDHHFPASGEAGRARFGFFQGKRHPRSVPAGQQMLCLVTIRVDFTALSAPGTALPYISIKGDRTFGICSLGDILLWSPEYADLWKNNCLEADTGPDVPFEAARNLRPAFPYNQMAFVTRQRGSEPIGFPHVNGSFN